MRERRPPSDRFWEKVDKNGPIPTHQPKLGPCWVWRGAKKPTGYGNFGVDGKTWVSHIWAWVEANGPVLEGLELDHLCRNPPCVRPAHLEPVSSRENKKRGPTSNGNKTHCPQGHPYNDANTYTDARGLRHCRVCGRIRARNQRQARRLSRSQTTNAID